jgi:hypothetical protein
MLGIVIALVVKFVGVFFDDLAEIAFFLLLIENG